MKLTAAFATSTACSFALLAALAGCSSDDGSATPDGGSTPDNGADGSVVPQPDGHAPWTKATNAAHYEVYPDRAAAIAWFESAKNRGDGEIASDSPVGSGDARYADVDAKVAAIWRGFVSAFPADTADLPPPIVLLVDSSRAGAYAVVDPQLDAAPHVFMIQTPTLALGDEALHGVIAHELTHHVLKHKWPGHAEQIEVWYDATRTAGEGFGFEQSPDRAVEQTGRTAQAYGLATGDYALPEWNGFVRPGGVLDDFIGYLHEKAAASNAVACAEANAAREALLAYADPLRDRATSTLAPTAEQRSQIDALAKAYLAKETACTSVVTGTFFDNAAEALGTTESAVRNSASDLEVESNDAAATAHDALVRLAKAYDSYLTTTDLTNVRYYSYEEQADDTSIEVLASLGLPASGMATFLEKGALNDAGRVRCNGFGSNEPPYGVISDAHHSTCWRIWHAKKVEAFISR